MTLIDIKDAGLARNVKYDVTVGVIDLVVTRRGADPERLRGYCLPEAKPGIISTLRQIIWEQDDR